MSSGLEGTVLVDATSQFIESLRDFLRKESPPSVAHAGDEAGEPPLGLLRQLGSLGYLAIGLPAEWGGESESESDTYALVRMMEEIGYHNLALGHLAGRTIYAEQLLLHFGTPAQQAAWIPGLREGRFVFSVGISEPQAGSDAASLALKATLDGDGYRLDGQKVFSSSMGYADVAMVAARTGSPESGRDGITTFLVDPKSEGIECRKLQTVGDWGVGTYEVFYDNVRVPSAGLFGELNGGWNIVTSHLVRERIVMAARAVGATKRVLDVVAKYVSERHQFGHPLAEFQVVAHKIADIAIQHYVAQSALYRLAQEASPSRTDASMVKTFASELYCRAAIEAMQLSGGYGYTHEFEVQRHFRDSRIYPVGGGSSEVMRDIIARHVLRPYRTPAQRRVPDRRTAGEHSGE
jgi:alkylation response protein AidB-like acyl-CoA dehydrogenase